MSDRDERKVLRLMCTRTIPRCLGTLIKLNLQSERKGKEVIPLIEDNYMEV